VLCGPPPPLGRPHPPAHPARPQVLTSMTTLGVLSLVLHLRTFGANRPVLLRETDGGVSVWAIFTAQASPAAGRGAAELVCASQRRQGHVQSCNGPWTMFMS